MLNMFLVMLQASRGTSMIIFKGQYSIVNKHLKVVLHGLLHEHIIS